MSELKRGRQRPSIRDAQKALTLEVLLDASWELYKETSYATTTIEQIVSRAGTSRATFYLHFDSKWQTVATRVGQGLHAEVIEFYKRLDGVDMLDRASLQSWIEDAVGYYEDKVADILVLRQASEVEPDLATATVQYVADYVDAMQNYMDRWGSERRSEAIARIGILVRLLTEFTTDWLLGRWDVDRETVVKVLTDFWLAGLSD